MKAGNIAEWRPDGLTRNDRVTEELRLLCGKALCRCPSALAQDIRTMLKKSNFPTDRWPIRGVLERASIHKSIAAECEARQPALHLVA